MKKVLIIIVAVVILAVIIYVAYLLVNRYGEKSTTTPNKPNTVEISNFAFSPQELTVDKGTEVSFLNLDSAAHTVTFDGFESGNLNKGDVYKHKFDVVGEFNYHCSLHPEMKGKIIVK